MDSIAIQGGAQLHGDIPVSGAKNSAIKLMAASILTDQPLLLTNMPRLADTRFLGQLLRQFGIEVTERDGADGQESLFHAKTLTSTFAPYDLVRQMRASFNVLGPLLARTGEAKVSLPGGCTIGARPVDLHLQALTALGAEIELDEGYVTARAPKGLKGAEIEFPFVSVGATEHALLAAVLANGTTVLKRAARHASGWWPYLTKPEDIPAKIDFIKSQPGYDGRPFDVMYGFATSRVGEGHAVVDDPRARPGMTAPEIIDRLGWFATLGVTMSSVPIPAVRSISEYEDYARWVIEEIKPKLA